MVWFLLSAGVAIVALWSLAVDMGGVVPAGPVGDFEHFAWNYWWIGHALENGLSPWYTDYVLFPHTHNLSLHTLTPIWFPYYWLAEPLAGRIVVVNSMIVLSFPINATVMALWLTRARVPAALAFTGGLVFAFQPYLLLGSAPAAHLNLLAAWWLPLTALLWAEIVQPTRVSPPVAAVLLGLALWGAALTDLQFALLLPLALVPHIAWTLWLRRDALAALLSWGALALMIVLILAWVVWPLPPLLETDTSNVNEFPPASLDTAQFYALPADSWIGATDSGTSQSLGRVFPWVVWIGVLMLVVNRRAARVAARAATGSPAWLWLLAALPAAVLMLGPAASIAGLEVRMPYRSLHDEFGGQYRTPERFVIPASFALVTFAGIVWSRPWQTLKPRQRQVVLPLVVAVLLADAGVLREFPVRPVRDYPIHTQIGQEDADYVVMDVPVGTHYGWTGLGEGRRTQLYAPIHEKRMVNGFVARMPYSDYAFFADSPLFSWLAHGDDLMPDQQATVDDLFARYRQAWPVGYVIAHREWMTREQEGRWIRWLNMQPGLCFPGLSDDGLLLWWRNADLGCDSLAATDQIDLDAVASWTHVGDGWYSPEDIAGNPARWTKQDAHLRLTVTPDTAYELTITALAFHENRVLTVNDGESVTIRADGWHDYTLTVPAEAISDGLLHLNHDAALSPGSLGMSGDERTLAVAYALIRLRPLPESP